MLVVASALLVVKPVLFGVYDATIVGSSASLNVTVAVAIPFITSACAIVSLFLVNVIVPSLIGFSSMSFTVAVSSTGLFVIIVSGMFIVVVVSVGGIVMFIVCVVSE